MSREWRVGGSWHAHGGLTTVVEIGDCPADSRGRREDDELIGVMKTPEDAELVCLAVNAYRDAATAAVAARRPLH